MLSEFFFRKTTIAVPTSEILHFLGRECDSHKSIRNSVNRINFHFYHPQYFVAMRKTFSARVIVVFLSFLYTIAILSRFYTLPFFNTSLLKTHRYFAIRSNSVKFFLFCFCSFSHNCSPLFRTAMSVSLILFTKVWLEYPWEED